MWSRAEGTEDAQQFGAGRGLAATFILREHASQEALPPEVVAVLIASIGRTISIENRLGITTGHPKTLRMIAEYLQRYESPNPRTAATSN